MLLALTDHLRCTEPHADSWLVARADVVESGRMVEGILGCPICHVERVVAGGVAYWSSVSGLRPRSLSPEAHPDRVIRIGALIAFGDSSAPYILCGAESNVAAGLGGLAETPIVLHDPPDDRAALLASIVRGATVIPFAAGAVQGIAVDAAHATEAFLDSCVRALVNGGRLVAPSSAPLPAGVREVARDAEQWVAEKDAVSATISLRRAGA
jgi:hypothetical protein